MKKLLFLLLLLSGNVSAQVDSNPVPTDTAGTNTITPQNSDIKAIGPGPYFTGLKVIVTDDVIVSSTRASANSPTAFQLLKKEELQKNNLGQDIPYLLDMTPSVVTTSDAGNGIGYSGIRIRGSDNSRINVTLNGVPVNDAESQGMFWVDLPDVISSAQSIQIQRGVGSSTNGPGAFGGTISVQTQTPSQTAYGGLDISGGSFGTLKMTGKAGTGMIKNVFFAEGSASRIVSNGYIDRASSNLYSFFAQTGIRTQKTLLKLLYFGGREKTYQSWNGVPEDSLKTNRTFNDLGTDYGQHQPPYENQVDKYSQDYFQLLLTQQLRANLYLNLAGFATLGRGYYEEYKAGTDFNNYFPGYSAQPLYTDLVRQKWLRNIFYGGTFSLNYEQNNVWLNVGGLFGQYRGKHFGKVIWAQEVPELDNDKHWYDGNSIKNDFNVYAKFNYKLIDRVNIYADLQYRYVHHTTSGNDNALTPYDINKTWHFVNPKAGLLYNHDNKFQVYGSLAIGHREPNRDDLMANPTTKSERLYDMEAGYKALWKLGTGRKHEAAINLNYFYMHYQDQLVLTGKLNDVGNPLKTNVPQSFRTGPELSGGFNFYKTIHPVVQLSERTEVLGYVDVQVRKVFAINYSFTYSLNKIRSFDEYIYTYDENYSPVDTLTLVINHKNTDISFSPSIIASLELVVYPVKGLSISLMNKAVSKQYLDNTSNDSRKIKPFFYSNLNITYSIPLNRQDREIRMTLLFNNIFNRLYESNGYTYSERYSYRDIDGNVQTDGPYSYNYYYPQAGFNVLAGMSVRF